MADTFSISIITADGANLIAQATSSNQIVMVDALSCTLAATDAADLASKTASWYDGVSGTIESSSATDNVAKVIAKFGNAGANPQAVKSVALRAKLANQADSAAVIIAAMSDANSEIVLPSSSSVAQVERVIFNFAINADEQTETVYADGATVADLARFVSMYKAGDPTQGEDQTIKGNKTFDNYCYFNDDVIFQDSITVNSNGSILSGFETVADAKIGSDAENPANLIVYGTCDLYDAVTCRDDITTVGDAQIGGDFLVNGTTTLLGDLDCGDISCDGITGLAPSGATGRKKIPVGGIIAVCPSGVSGWDSDRFPTTTITINSETNLPIAEWNCGDGRFDASPYTIDDGTYMLLTGWNYATPPVSTYGIVFLIRTA